MTTYKLKPKPKFMIIRPAKMVRPYGDFVQILEQAKSKGYCTKLDNGNFIIHKAFTVNNGEVV